MRPIDADALKDKLQQHHDFYVMAWCGFGKMPIGEKKRVDEITNCIAEVVNAPTIEPKRGEWKHLGGDEWLCPECGHVIWTEGSWEHPLERGKFYCENCGARMKGEDNE